MMKIAAIRRGRTVSSVAEARSHSSLLLLLEGLPLMAYAGLASVDRIASSATRHLEESVDRIHGAKGDNPERNEPAAC